MTILAILVAGVLLFPIRSQAKDPFQVRSLSSCSLFISHEEVRALFLAYERDFPDIARAFVAGQSVQSRDIFGLRLSADPDGESTEPEIRILGGIHGDECMSVELVAEIATHLVSAYGDDTFATELLDRAEVVLIPLVNPDGYVAPKAYRYNANGVDLNRNFHFAWVNGGPKPFSEPESRAIRDLGQERNFVMSISYHTVQAYVNASWNYTPHHPPDDELFSAMGVAYAGSSGYKATFGWDWYGIYGDVDDWSLGTRGTFGWTIELRHDRDMEFPVHLAGLEAFLPFAFVGIKGTVTDAETGDPIPSRLEVMPEGAPIFTDPAEGDFHRILMPGTYDVTAHSPGYVSKTAKGVTVGETGAFTLDFSLDRFPQESVDFAFAVNGMTLPQEIDGTLSIERYLNDTVVWDALGEPDGWVYSLSPGGSVTLDMGENGLVTDVKGTDIVIVSGSISDDPVTVQVADNQDGPFVFVGKGDGHIAVDISESGFDAIRFVRIVDTGDGDFKAQHAGYDLDAVVNVTKGDYKLPVVLSDDGGDEDACGCTAVGAPDLSLFQALQFIFETNTTTR